MARLQALAWILLVASCTASEDISDAGTPSSSSSALIQVSYNALYVVNGGDASVSVINTTTNEVMGTVKYAHIKYPHHLYMSADRSHLLLSVPGMDMSGG